jgi:hypothetical protein
MFYPRFVEPIRSGRKRQTIRPSTRGAKPGDMIALRAWSGKAYRSKQTPIIEPRKCIAVSAVHVQVDVWRNTIGVSVNGVFLDHDAVCRFVRADGFSCVSDMADYYASKKVDDFAGFLIEWEAPTR